MTSFIADPPAQHRALFKSLLVGLDTCPVNYALMTNLTVCIDQVRSFWRSARIDPRNQKQLTGHVGDKIVVINEAAIRSALHITDKPTDPKTIPPSRVLELLPLLSYEERYPPLVKKLLHPYWRLLCHIFLVCLCSNKGGTDKLNKDQGPVIEAALINGTLLKRPGQPIEIAYAALFLASDLNETPPPPNSTPNKTPAASHPDPSSPPSSPTIGLPRWVKVV